MTRYSCPAADRTKSAYAACFRVIGEVMMHGMNDDWEPPPTLELPLPRSRYPQEPVIGLFGIQSGVLHAFADCVICGTQKRHITVGRARRCDIQVADPTVSLLHCEILLEANGLCIIQDVESRNGLYVNDVHVQRAILWPGMWIFIGKSELVAAGENGMVPVTATSYTSFLGKAALYHGSARKAAKATGRSRSTILRGAERYETKHKESGK